VDNQPIDHKLTDHDKAQARKARILMRAAIKLTEDTEPTDGRTTLGTFIRAFNHMHNAVDAIGLIREYAYKHKLHNEWMLTYDKLKTWRNKCWQPGE
jgi:hypothetical protein